MWTPAPNFNEGVCVTVPSIPFHSIPSGQLSQCIVLYTLKSGIILESLIFPPKSVFRSSRGRRRDGTGRRDDVAIHSFNHSFPDAPTVRTDGRRTNELEPNSNSNSDRLGNGVIY